VNLLSAALLGVLQGLTEFLPVSSSAHLILARAFFGWDAEQFGLAFDVACHVGTLAAVMVYFRAELRAMVLAAPRALTTRETGVAGRLLRLIVVGTVPIVVVGLLFKSAIEIHVRSPAVAAATLAFVGLALIAVERLGPRRRAEHEIGWQEALWIGMAQACALVPGVSRSGATITVGMLCGLRRDAAARFGFLLGMPAILAAATAEAVELRQVALSPAIAQLFVIGTVTSALVGYVTVKYFIRYLAGHRLNAFGYYRLGLAAITLAWLMA
jgi:undecaprenyl-diphosphatase